VQVSQKVTVKVSVHDLMVRIWPNGAGGQHLRKKLWLGSLEIFCQSDINELMLGGMVRFEIESAYNYRWLPSEKHLEFLELSF